MDRTGAQCVEQDSQSKVCYERRRLSSEFLAAVRDITTLENQQIQAVISDDPDFARFDLLLHVAVERKRQAKYALLHHIQTHSC